MRHTSRLDGQSGRPTFFSTRPDGRQDGCSDTRRLDGPSRWAVQKARLSLQPSRRPIQTAHVSWPLGLSSLVFLSCNLTVSFVIWDIVFYCADWEVQFILATVCWPIIVVFLVFAVCTKQDLEVGQVKPCCNCCSRPQESNIPLQRCFGSHCQWETCKCIDLLMCHIFWHYIYCMQTVLCLFEKYIATNRCEKFAGVDTFCANAYSVVHLLLIIYILCYFNNNLDDMKWPFMCWCAVKWCAHSLDLLTVGNLC